MSKNYPSECSRAGNCVVTRRKWFVLITVLRTTLIHAGFSCPAFISVEGSKVVKLVSNPCQPCSRPSLNHVPYQDLNGKVTPHSHHLSISSLSSQVLDNYIFNRVLIHDVAITPDSHRLLCVGPILSSPAGLHPSKSRVEKQLLGWY